MTISIRRRLLITLVLAISSTWIVVVAYLYFGAKREIQDLFDTQLEESAKVTSRTLLGLSIGGKESGSDTASSSETDEQNSKARYQKNLVLQVWDPSGNLYLHSESAPLSPLSELSNGFSDSSVAGKKWRTFSYTDPKHGVTVRVGEPYDARTTLTHHVVGQTVYPLLFGLPLLGLLIWVAVGRGLSPINRIARDVSERDSTNLNTLSVAGVPEEVRPLIEALNELLCRLDLAFDRERRFTSDASHELRTPLAGLKTQAQVALEASQGSERRRAILNVLKGVDRAAHLVDQLLTLSRFDQAHEIPVQPVDLAAVVRNVSSDVSSQSNLDDIKLQTPLGGTEKMIWANSDAVYVLVRNLIDNAMRYSPAGGTVRIAILGNSETVSLEVCDRGPGIPEEELENVKDRFYRGSDASGEGSGLGLSIVQRVVELQHAQFTLQANDNGSGLLARVVFKAAEAQPESLTTGSELKKADGPSQPSALQPATL